jgi:AcrR family transcriptional regulator
VNLHSHSAKVNPLEAKQARSRLTLHRLLSAAEALLEHGGLEAATVPAIAETAGVSVGVVYRRFPDKDARAIIVGMTHGYRQRRGLLRALLRYARTHQDAGFRAAAKKMDQDALRAIVYLLMRHRNQIAHPRPERAIELGLVAVAATLQNLLLEEDALHVIEMPENLEEEMVRLFFGYLGIAQGE